MPKLSPIQISLAVIFMIGLGAIVASGRTDPSSEEPAYKLVVETLEKASTIPLDSAENVRRRLWLYIGVHR